jgi:hypothetical protein
MIECPARKLAGFFMRFAIQDLLWLLLAAGILCAWWIQNSRLSTRLHWATLRADTNDGAVWQVCKAFEREEGYQCDICEIETKYGNFYSGVNVIRPTDNSFWIDLPGQKYRYLSVHLRDEWPGTDSN